MRVLRVENAQREGPYSLSLVPIGFRCPLDIPRHPSPNDDRGLALRWSEVYSKRDDYRFGFASEAQLDAWFSPDDLNYLARYAFGVRVYEVPEESVTEGSRQVMFRHADAQFLGTLRQLKGIQA